MKRRTFFGQAIAVGLAAPRLGAAQRPSLLRFVPIADLTQLDPIAATSPITRNHGYLVWDTLYGVDDAYNPQPQMLQGHEVNYLQTTWLLTLREGLRFHDGQPVLARDVVASLRRWGKRDVFGKALMNVTDELSAPTDRTVRFRLNQPFPLLPAALSKVAPCMPCIMPERLAQADPFTAVAEIVGSGPYRFVPGERVVGSRTVYERFAGYVPRNSGRTEQTAGPKIAAVDRIEWVTIPDASTASGALQSGEVDWVESPNPDLLPLLRGSRALTVKIHDESGYIPVFRFNALQPPFDNPAVRRAVLAAVDQSQCVQAYSNDASLYHDRVGVFPPGTPMASDAGMSGLFGTTDVGRAKAQLAAAGYKGERVVFIAATDGPISGAVSPVMADIMTRIGFNVDYQAVDLGTLYQRRASREPIDKGGWSCFITSFNGVDLLDPAVSQVTRGDSTNGWYGWPTSPQLEALHSQWLEARDLVARQAIAGEIQLQVWQDATFVPLGQVAAPTAYRASLSGVLNGFPKFWNVRKA